MCPKLFSLPLCSIFILLMVSISNHSMSQNLEIEGKAKIMVMDTVSHADSIVVRLPDGSLAVRHVNTLPRDFLAGDPKLIGSLSIGFDPRYIYVSGRFVYVLDRNVNELQIIDVSNHQAPELVGSVAVGTYPTALFVSGRYAFVVDFQSEDLKIIDISNPQAPNVVGSLGVGTYPQSVYVSGKYAYIADSQTKDLKVVDITDPADPILIKSLYLNTILRYVHVSGKYVYLMGPSDLFILDASNPRSPFLIGSLNGFGTPNSILVSGRYAYVTDGNQNDLKIIDIADPSNPSIVSSFPLGDVPYKLFLAGRYCYVVDFSSDDLRVIDIENPMNPTLVGIIPFGSSSPEDIFVSGGIAYVIDKNTHDLKIIDVSNTEFAGVIAHSLETGVLQVRNNITSHGHLDVKGSLQVGAGGIFSDGDLGVAGTVLIKDSLRVPMATITDKLITKGPIEAYDGLDIESGILSVDTIKAKRITVSKDIFAQGELSAKGIDLGLNGMNSDGDITVNGSMTISDTLDAEDITIGDDLTVNDDLTVLGKLSVENIFLEPNATANGDLIFNGQLGIIGAQDANLSGGGYVVLGNLVEKNMVLDNNEIMARENGLGAPLFLNHDGGKVAIGDINSADLSDKLHVNSDSGEDAMRIQVDGTTRLRVFANGSISMGHNTTLGASTISIASGYKMGLGDSSPDATLDVVGDIYYTGDLMDVSDSRLKEKIKPITSAVEKLVTLKGFTYQLLGESKRSAGVSAQDVNKILPEAVNKINNEYLGVDYSQLIPLLIEAIKDQQAMIQSLKSQNELQQKQIEGLLKH